MAVEKLGYSRTQGTAYSEPTCRTDLRLRCN